MRKLTIALSDEIYAEIDRLSERTGVTKAGLISLACRHLIEEERIKESRQELSRLQDVTQAVHELGEILKRMDR